jgi:hypothetical protein
MAPNPAPALPNRERNDVLRHAVQRGLSFTSHESRVTNHAVLLDTPKRVETPVSRRKQSTGYPSTRDDSHPDLAPSRRQISGRKPSRAALFGVPETLRILGRLIDTPERLESRVSHSKQTTGSNRYTSHPASFHQFFSSALPAFSARRRDIIRPAADLK